MAYQLTVKMLLEKAIRKEIESQQLYQHLSEKMTDRAAQDAFRQLTQEEQGHQAFLEDYLQGKLEEGTLGREQVLDYKIAEHLEQPGISPDMKLKDVFLMAANHEKASNEFYLQLAVVHPPGRIRRLLEQLASQELEHKHKVEFLYTEVAFPQTDGG